VLAAHGLREPIGGDAEHIAAMRALRLYDGGHGRVPSWVGEAESSYFDVILRGKVPGWKEEIAPLAV
jgi:hypothetical protein